MKAKIKDFSERGGKILILLSLALYAPTLTMGIAERIFKLKNLKKILKIGKYLSFRIVLSIYLFSLWIAYDDNK